MIFSKGWRKKEGRYIHDGDCHFWGLKVCTCGLLQHLQHIFFDGFPRREIEVWTENVYPTLHEDLAYQQHAMDHLLRNPAPPIQIMSEEESNRMIDELFKEFKK